MAQQIAVIKDRRNRFFFLDTDVAKTFPIGLINAIAMLESENQIRPVDPLSEDLAEELIAQLEEKIRFGLKED